MKNLRDTIDSVMHIEFMNNNNFLLHKINLDKNK